MKIEEAIKSKFLSSMHKAVVNINYTHNWLRDKQMLVFGEYEMQPQHFNVLRILSGSHPKPLSPGEIKDVMLDKGSDVTRLLEKLEKQGLLERRICPTNRRKIDVRINERGIEMANEISDRIKNAFSDVRKNLTAHEFETLSNLLDKLRS